MRHSSIGIVTALAAVGCASGGSSGTAAAPSAAPQASAQQAGDPGRAYVANLVANNASGNRITGTVKLTPTGAGEYRAEVMIRNAGGMQNKYPWIIRGGQCFEMVSTIELGNPIGYKVLETGPDGTARINAPLKVQIPSGVFHVDILKSTSERESVVSCGVLSPG